jgi:hypothetical protein
MGWIGDQAIRLGSILRVSMPIFWAGGARPGQKNFGQ